MSTSASGVCEDHGPYSGWCRACDRDMAYAQGYQDACNERDGRSVFVVLWQTYGIDDGKIAVFSTEAHAERCAERWRQDPKCDGAPVYRLTMDEAE